MSVTFGVTEQLYIKCTSGFFNAREPEDPIFNPRTSSVGVYPELNVSNINAGSILRILGHYTQDLCGEIKKEELDEFIEICVQNNERLSRAGLLSTDEERFHRYFRALEIVSKSAKALGKTICWA